MEPFLVLDTHIKFLIRVIFPLIKGTMHLRELIDKDSVEKIIV